MRLTQFLFADPAVSEILEGVRAQRAAAHPLPLLVNGLSGGALDSFACEAALSLARGEGVPSLFLVPEENRVAPLTEALCAAGLRAFAFPARNLIFHAYAASHDLERERLFVLRALLAGEADAQDAEGQE